MAAITVPKTRDVLRWAPLSAIAAWLCYLGISGGLDWNLAGLTIAGIAGVCWLIGRGIWPTVVLFSLLLSPLIYHFAVQLPSAEQALRAAMGRDHVRIAATVRRQTRVHLGEHSGIHYLLGEVSIHRGGQRSDLAELEVRFAGRLRTWRALRKEIRIGGMPVAVVRHEGRLILELKDAEYHFVGQPLTGIWNGRGGEWMRHALGDRAGYYLPQDTLAVYLPIVLGVRTLRSPEARRVVQATRRVGIAHLFAISGLHVGLLFLIFMAVQHFASGFFVRGQGWAHSRQMGRVMVMVVIWGYIVLIGFPIPAVRAAIMGTMILMSQIWGTRSPRIYVLVFAGGLMLAHTPTQFYDLSFRLSFLAFFFIVAVLNLWEDRPRTEAPPSWLRRIASASGFNLLSTTLITLGLWPVIATAFGQISLLVFVANLLMIPLLSLLVLPSGLLALLTSFVYLGALPGSWVERLVFGWLDLVLSFWLIVVRTIDTLGQPLVFHVDLAWSLRAYFLYYSLLISMIWILTRMNRPGAAAATLVWVRRRFRGVAP